MSIYVSKLDAVAMLALDIFMDPLLNPALIASATVASGNTSILNLDYVLEHIYKIVCLVRAYLVRD